MLSEDHKTAHVVPAPTPFLFMLLERCILWERGNHMFSRHLPARNCILSIECPLREGPLLSCIFTVLWSSYVTNFLHTVRILSEGCCILQDNIMIINMAQSMTGSIIYLCKALWLLTNQPPEPWSNWIETGIIRIIRPKECKQKKAAVTVFSRR